MKIWYWKYSRWEKSWVEVRDAPCRGPDARRNRWEFAEVDDTDFRFLVQWKLQGSGSFELVDRNDKWNYWQFKWNDLKEVL